MKKAIALLLILCLALTGCSSGDDTKDTKTTPAATATTAPEATTALEATATPEPTATPA